MTLCGTVDKSCQTTLSTDGMAWAGPGKVPAAYEWNRILSKSEFDQSQKLKSECSLIESDEHAGEGLAAT